MAAVGNVQNTKAAQPLEQLLAQEAQKRQARRPPRSRPHAQEAAAAPANPNVGTKVNTTA